MKSLAPIVILFGLFICGSSGSDKSSYIVKYMRHERPVLLNDRSPVLNCSDFDAQLEMLKTDETQIELNEEDENLDDFDYYDDNYVDLLDVNPVTLKFKESEKDQISLLFDPLNPNNAIGFANARPEIIMELTDCQLNHVLKWEQVIKNLKDSTIDTLMKSTQISSRLQQVIPHSTVAKLLTLLIRPGFIQSFADQDYPLKDYILRLLRNQGFIRYLNKTFIVGLMNEPASYRLIDSRITLTVLSVFPDIPMQLDQESLDYGSLYMLNQDFLNRLPCAVFMNAVANSTFVNKVSSGVLQAMSQNEHFWACMPVELVRHMMLTTKLASKLDLEDWLVATKTMSKAKSMDEEVVRGIFAIQFPQLLSKAESDFFDTFNSYANHDWSKTLKTWLP